MKGKQLLKKLRQAGVEIDQARGKGGHRLATYKGRSATIPIHGDTDLGPNFIRKLCKQLGLDPKTIL